MIVFFVRSCFSCRLKDVSKQFMYRAIEKLSQTGSNPAPRTPPSPLRLLAIFFVAGVVEEIVGGIMLLNV